MIGQLSRRRFLAGATLAPWLLSRASAASKGRQECLPSSGGQECPPSSTGAKPPKPRPILDIHVHLLGTGDNNSGCRLSDAIQKGPLFIVMAQVLRIRRRARTLDEGYVLALAEQLEQSGLDGP